MCHCGCGKLLPKPKVTDSGHCCIACNRRIFASFTCFDDHDPEITQSSGICKQCAKDRPKKGKECLKREYEDWLITRQSPRDESNQRNAPASTLPSAAVVAASSRIEKAAAKLKKLQDTQEKAQEKATKRVIELQRIEDIKAQKTEKRQRARAER